MESTVSAKEKSRSAWIGASSTLFFSVAFLPCAQSAPTPAEAVQLEEVIVTAQKKEERLQDVPVPVTAINAVDLVETHQLSIEDYYTRVPGLSLTTSAYGQQSIIIRGITTGVTATNPTVGVVVDGLPFGSAVGGGTIFPDIDPSDMQSLEVLRGPQGTLYGASSMGGLVNFITKDPSFTGVSGRLQADVSSVKNGDGPGYGVRGSVNLPLSDTLALRASVSARRDAGFIDNLGYASDLAKPIRGVNEINAYGGHLALLWKPSDNLSVKLGATLQQTKQDGQDMIDAAFVESLQQQVVPGLGASNRKYDVYSATVNAKIGGADFTSITGYSINDRHNAADFSSAYGAVADSFFHDPPIYNGDEITEATRTRKFSQELRLNMPLGANVDWLVGGFYTHEDSPYLQQLIAFNEMNGAVVGSAINFNATTVYSEYAAFTDLTVRFTDRFDVQFGGRGSFSEQSFLEVDTGPATQAFDNNPPPYDYGGKLHSKDHAFTYLVTPRFKLTPEIMIYARAASGFRPGGPNGAVPFQFQVDPTYKADKTQNFEVGLKGDLLDHRLTADLSLYYIDWKNIQLHVSTPTGFAYNINASSAKSEGAELSLKGKVTDGLVLSGWVAWNEAVVTQTFPNPSIRADPGDRLPFSPRISGTVAADYDFPLATSVEGFVGLSVNHVGFRFDDFTSPSDPLGRRTLPPYARTDLRAGVRFDPWSVALFANNVTDRRGELLNNNVPYVNIIPPRTIGVTVSRNF